MNNNSYKKLLIIFIIIFIYLPNTIFSIDQVNSPTDTYAFMQPDDILTAAAILGLAIAHDSEGKTLSEQVDSKVLSKNLAKVYDYSFLITLSHEFGHAFFSYIFDGSPFNIHIGSRPIQTPHADQTPLCKIGPIAIDSLNPFRGYSRNSGHLSAPQACIMLVAGPLSGFMAYYMLKTIDIFQEKYFKQKDTEFSTPLFEIFTASVQDAFTKSTILDALALKQLLYLTIPMGNWGDGSKLWKYAGCNPTIVDTIGKFGTFIINGLPVLFVLKKVSTDSLFFENNTEESTS